MSALKECGKLRVMQTYVNHYNPIHTYDKAAYCTILSGKYEVYSRVGFTVGGGLEA